MTNFEKNIEIAINALKIASEMVSQADSALLRSSRHFNKGISEEISPELLKELVSTKFQLDHELWSLDFSYERVMEEN